MMHESLTADRFLSHTQTCQRYGERQGVTDRHEQRNRHEQRTVTNKDHGSNELPDTMNRLIRGTGNKKESTAWEICTWYTSQVL